MSRYLEGQIANMFGELDVLGCICSLFCAGSSVVERSIAARRVTGSNPVSRYFVKSYAVSPIKVFGMTFRPYKRLVEVLFVL